jgi:hypothetical protein
MTSQQIEQAVRDAFLKADPKGASLASMFVRWITGGFISSQGRFIIRKITACKMTVKSYESARFTCKVTASTAPNYDNSVTLKYTWVLKGNHFKGEYTQ